MKRTKSNVLVAAAVAVLALSAAGAAWACTTQQQLTLLPRTGVAGSPVVVTGTGFDGSPVTIRWNSTTGPVVGAPQTASLSSFSAPATIPADAAPGVYYLVAVSKGMVARAAISVQASASSPSRAVAASNESTQQTSGDLWGALQGHSGAVQSVGQPTGSSDASGAGRAAGIALLATGIAGLGVGTTAFIARRKKAPANRSAG